MELLTFVKQDMKVQKRLLKSYGLILEKLPKGGLIYKTGRGKVRFYHVDRNCKTKTYIGEDKKALLGQLKLRKLLENAVEVMKTNLILLEKFIEKYRVYDLEVLRSQLNENYQDIDLKKFEKMCAKSYDEDFAKASQSPFKDGLTRRTSFGLYVRSKTEVLIAELLYAAGIPFRYEPELIIVDESGVLQTYYPDFAIITHSGNIIYWEHLGMMDKQGYRSRTFKKIADYHHNGIFPPLNLILTMEDPSGAIDVSAFMRIIESLKPMCCRL